MEKEVNKGIDLFLTVKWGFSKDGIINNLRIEKI
jgi:hypothetical protein